MKDFVLGSASPRRREILAREGYDFTVLPASCEEFPCAGMTPTEYVKALALAKARDVYMRTDKLTLGADTVVVLDGKILGKPANKSVNAQFLRDLSGKSHFVYTGFAIVGKGVEIVDYDSTEVIFNRLDADLINKYVNEGLGLDKAGGYGIQDGYDLVDKIVGSFNNVVGLPIEKINKLLKELL